MFAGHLGAGLALGLFERKINVGLFVFAAMLVDFVLWCWQAVLIPPDYAVTRQIEAGILIAGLLPFLGRSGLPRFRKTGHALLSLVVLTFTMVGMTVAPPPPSIQTMAASSLVMIVVVSALAAWLSRRSAGPSDPSYE